MRRLWIKGLGVDGDVVASFHAGEGSTWRQDETYKWSDRDSGSIWHLRGHECVVLVSDEVAAGLKANPLVEVLGEILD